MKYKIKKIINYAKKLLIFIVSYKLKHKKPLILDDNKVLIRTYDALGDVIIATPIFRELKKNYPNIQLDVMCSPKNYTFLTSNQYIDNVYVVSLKPTIKELKNIFIFYKNHYDIFIDLWGRISLLSLFLIRIFNAKRNFALSTEESYRPKYQIGVEDLYFYDLVFGKDLTQHQRERYLDLFDQLNIPVTNKNYEINYSKIDSDKTKQFLQKYIQYHIVGFSYHGSNPGNTFSVQTTILIIKNLLEVNKNILIILFYEENYMIDAKKIINTINDERCILSLKTVKFSEFCALINYCNTIITVGTSTLHIASTFNKNIIAIYPDSQYYRNFAPFSKQRIDIIYIDNINNIKQNTIYKVASSMQKIEH